jgi:flagellar motor switch protein FliM
MEQQVLSQSEVDALLNAVSDGRIDSHETEEKRDESSFVRYDLTNQRLISFTTALSVCSVSLYRLP